MHNESGAGSRRSFLRSTAALSGALALQAKAGTGNTPPPPLPTVKFGKFEISRLIVGSNPLYGYSHFNHTFDQLMREWYTQDRKMEVLHACERHGIATWQLHYNDQPFEDYHRYRAEGGKMHLILLADFALMKDPKLLPEVVKLGPLGIGHHGNRTDERFRNGEKGKIKDFLKAVRDTGVMVGLSTHNPAVIERPKAKAGTSTTTSAACIAYRGPPKRRAPSSASRPSARPSWRRIPSACAT